MKIAYLLKNLPEKSTTFIHNEIDCLRDRGNEVYLFPIWDIMRSKLPLSITEKDDYNYKRFSLLSPVWIIALIYFLIRKPGLVLKSFLEPRRLYGTKFVLKSLEAALVIRLKGVSRIHTHMLSLATTRARMVSMLLKIPYTITAHGSDLLINPPDDSKELLENAQSIITPTKYNKNRIKEIAGDAAEGNVRVIPYYVDTDFFSPLMGERSKRGIVEIISVGRLHPVKGYDYLLKAMEVLLKGGVKSHLTILGDGDERGRLDRLIEELCIEKFVTFKGALYAEELRDCLRVADIFVLSSISEGLPVSMLEAMSVGLPVVVPGITGIPEMINPVGRGRPIENGVMFESKNHEDLAEKLKLVITDSGLRERLGDEARKTIIRKCLYDSTFGEIVNIIKGTAS